MRAFVGVAVAIATFIFCLSVVQAQSIISGLDFPGSAAVTTTMRFEFLNPQNNGLPIYGPGGKGVTYIWRAYPRQQSSYYTAFFWGNADGSFYWGPPGQETANTFYGAHPYPNPPPNGTNHDWEIAVNAQDIVHGVVEYDRWFTQAFRVWSDGSGKHHEFYWDLPNTDTAHLVTADIAASYGNTNPPLPALTWGDAPWNPGNEVWNGVLRGLQIYATKLTLSEIAAEIANPLSTGAGAASIWYLNMNPTPTDISDKSGAGHNPSWVGSERPSLYMDSGPPTPTPPSAPSGLSISAISTSQINLSWNASRPVSRR